MDTYSGVREVMKTLTFRNVTDDDAERLAEIYSYYVEHTAITFEWTVPSVDEFRARISSTEEKYPYIAAVKDGRIIGYAYAGPFNIREAYDWAAEMSIYLDASVRHQGAGRKLYEVMEEILRKMHILNLYACIGVPKQEDEYLSDNSVRFHEHLDYHPAGTFQNCGYKFGRWYDMVWMEKNLGSHTNHPLPVLNYQAVKSALIGTVLTS